MSVDNLYISFIKEMKLPVSLVTQQVFLENRYDPFLGWVLVFCPSFCGQRDLETMNRFQIQPSGNL